MIQGALESAPDAGFGERVERIHDEIAAIGAQERAATEIHEIGAPAGAIVVAAMDGAEDVCVGGDGLENYRARFLLAVGENNVHAVDAEGVAFAAIEAGGAGEAIGWRSFFFAFALFERLEIIENVMADFFQVFRDVLVRIFFF